MKITIITGGSGSEDIQKGLYKISPYLEVNLIINGYDDGKSTGVLRRLFPGTLGISDFRKNQVLEYKLINGNTPIYNLLNHRFTSDEPYKYIIKYINNTEMNSQLKQFFLENTQYFFNLSFSKQIEYNDFSFMNIIYCSLLHKNNNDIEIVCSIIKKEFRLKNNIYLNSPDVLILNGITKKGNILVDEDSIVNFTDKTDKIIDVFFEPLKPFPILNKNTEEILLNSDIIIFSCGTQFSSLIPTYKTELFKEVIEKSKASKYLILNADYDKDIINYTGDELLDKINEYLPLLSDIKIIISKDSMNPVLVPSLNKYNYLNIPKLITNKKHNGKLLWKYILNDYFKYFFNDTYIFDYDYTLFDKNNILISEENIKLLGLIKNKLIVTNNCISNLKQINDCIIYSNMGNIYNYNGEEEIINFEYTLDDNTIDFVKQIIKELIIENSVDISNRKNISISIKPVYNRNEIICKLNTDILNSKNIKAIATGKTTIEFIKNGLSKRNIFTTKGLLDKTYTYITDHNDINYNSNTDDLKYLQIENINKTNLFLKTIIMNQIQKYDFCIIVGGINKRMEIDSPKCLIIINNEIVLLKLIRQILPYSNKIFICASNYYKNHFLEFEKNTEILELSKTSIITFLYFNSIDNEQNYPKGNGETIYQLLQTHELTEKTVIMWGDFILNDNQIFEELYNYSFDMDYDMIIPTVYEEHPYAYLIINEKNKVDLIDYQKNIDISFGYHDQCIFLCNTQSLQNKIKLLINENNSEPKIEKNFLDIVDKLENVLYYQTIFNVKSFNTFTEI